MPQVTVKTPFVARIGGDLVRIEKGQQDLSDCVIDYAKSKGFLDESKPLKPAVKEEQKNA